MPLVSWNLQISSYVPASSSIVAAPSVCVSTTTSIGASIGASGIVNVWDEVVLEVKRDRVTTLVTVIWSGEKKELDMTTSATGSSEGEADPEDGGDVDAAGDVVAAGDEVSLDAHAAASETSTTTTTST